MSKPARKTFRRPALTLSRVLMGLLQRAGCWWRWWPGL